MKCIREICPATLVGIKPIHNGRLSLLLLDMLYEHSLPGIHSVRNDRMHVVEVGLLAIAIPGIIEKKKRDRLIVHYVRPTQQNTSGIEIDYVLLGAWGLGKLHIAFVPMAEFDRLGTHVSSIYHRYFTIFPLEISKIAQIAEEKRLKKNLEMREMLAKQWGL